MTLPSGGYITMQQIADELGISSSGLNLNDSRVRALAGVPSGTISMAMLWGKSNMPAVTYYEYTQPGGYSFTNPQGPYGVSGILYGAEGGGGGGGGAGEYNWRASAAGGSGGAGGFGEEIWFAAVIEPGDVFNIVVGKGGYGGDGGSGFWTGLGQGWGYYQGTTGNSGYSGEETNFYILRNGNAIYHFRAAGGGGGEPGAGAPQDNPNAQVRGGNGGPGWPGGNAGAYNNGVNATAGGEPSTILSARNRVGQGRGGYGGYWGPGTANEQNMPPTRFGISGAGGIHGYACFTLLKATNYTNDSIQGFSPGGVPTAPSSGGGGGGGGGGTCVAVGSFLPTGITAGDTKNGDVMELADPETLEAFTGVVTYSKPFRTQGFRLVTASGASLVCSDSAPIPTRTGYVTPRLLIGHEVPVRRDDIDKSEVAWEQVVFCIAVGEIEVQHITVGDRCFWAGEIPGAYILHHNLKEIDQNPM